MALFQPEQSEIKDISFPALLAFKFAKEQGDADKVKFYFNKRPNGSNSTKQSNTLMNWKW